MTIISTLLLLIFSFLSALHFYWGFGGMWGLDSSVPVSEDGKRLLNPTALHSFVVGAGLFFFGLLAGIKGGVISAPIPQVLSDYGLYMVAVIFLARAIGNFSYVGFFKKLKNTPFGVMDSLLYSPLTLIISVLCAILQKMN